MTWGIITPEDQEALAVIDSNLHAEIVQENYERLNWLAETFEVMTTPEASEIVQEQITILKSDFNAFYHLFGRLQNVVIALKEQRDEALLNAKFWKDRSAATIHQQTVGNISIQQDIGTQEAARLLDWLTGGSCLELSRFTQRDLQALIARMNEELFEEALLQAEADEELWGDDDDE